MNGTKKTAAHKMMSAEVLFVVVDIFINLITVVEV
jgi:hypothetical protein